MTPPTVRPALPTDFPALRPMLLDMGFVEDEVALELEMRFPAFCAREDFALLVAEDGEGRLLGYAAVHDYGPHLRSGNSHRTAKLDDLYTIPDARKQGVARALMRAGENWARSRPLRYVFWYANERVAPVYERMGYRSGLPFGGRRAGGLPLLRNRPRGGEYAHAASPARLVGTLAGCSPPPVPAILSS